MNGRRDFLKLFGVGAVVVPVIEGFPSGEQARIIEPPKVELISAPELVQANHVPAFGESDIVMFVRDRRTMQVSRYEIAAMKTDHRIERVDVTSSYGAFREFIPGAETLTFTAITKPTVRAVR